MNKSQELFESLCERYASIDAKLTALNQEMSDFSDYLDLTKIEDPILIEVRECFQNDLIYLWGPVAEAADTLRYSGHAMYDYRDELGLPEVES